MKNKIDLELLHSGKVRDIYNIDDDLMLMVASDRISAFDSVFDEKITGKGATLTKIANFWFDKTSHIVPNHLTNIDPNKFGSFNGEAIVVKKLKPLPIEAIVRGYIIGSGWNDYQKTGSICGIELAKNLQLAQKLDKPIYTPSSKAEVGDHDENISFAKTIDLVGKDLAEKLRDVSIALYEFAKDYADSKGIIIADTKFEFGLDKDDNLVLMDEVLTPDSSRFWDKKLYKVGTSPASFDKQILRDYLNSTDWDKNPPAPQLPQDILDKTANKYQQVAGIFDI
jgi:phosphoribosylaminoimidazole-succinocarboxamide synthase